MVKADYQYQQHPHVEARKENPPHQVHHRKKKLSLNDRIGLGITKRVGTMWAAYIFVALSLVSLPAALASGDTVIIVQAAANRDPDVFADPDRFTITRPNAREHLSLAFGPHFCLGAALARVEGGAVFARLAARSTLGFAVLDAR